MKLTAPSRARPNPLLVLALTGSALALVLGMSISLGPEANDTRTYYYAAERLATGGSVYTLRSGDPRPLLGADDPQFGLYSPPLIAVVWRPIALLPQPIALGSWWILMAAMELASVIILLLGRPVAGGLATIIVSPAIALVIMVGNLDAAVLLGGIAAWLALLRGHERGPGIILGILSALKVTPILLVAWLLIVGRRTAFVWAVATIGITTVITLLGTYPSIFTEYIRVVQDVSTSAPNLAGVAAFVRGFGVAPEAALWAPRLAVVGLLLIAVVARKNPAAAFAALVAAMVLGSPAGGWHTYALLLLALAPLLRADGAGAWSRPLTGLLPLSGSVR